MNRTAWALLALLALGSPGSALAQDVGQFAADPDTKSWLNTAPDFSWKQLRGRLVLIERWATT